MNENEKKIFEKYNRIAKADWSEFEKAHTPEENRLAQKGYREAMDDLRDAICEAYECGTLDLIEAIRHSKPIPRQKWEEYLIRKLFSEIDEADKHIALIYGQEFPSTREKEFGRKLLDIRYKWLKRPYKIKEMKS